MQTVIAAFPDRSQAERACAELAQRGFDRGDMHIEQQDATSAEYPATDTERKSSSGGISGFFSRLFGNDDDDETQGSTWHEAVRRGRAVLVVDARDERQAEEAASCLNTLGALDIDEQASQWRSQGWTGASRSTAGQTGARSDKAVGKTESLKVVQEELKVGKRRVDRGGVRIVQRISDKPVREVVSLREEHAVVERTPVNRPADASDLTAFKEGTMEVRESAEEAVVAKTARVVEEVRVGKEVREHDEVIEEKLRRKDVDVERLQSEERERAYAANAKDKLTGNREGSPGVQRTHDLGKTPGKGGPR